MEEISEDEAKSFEGKCTFLSDYFDMDSGNFDFDTLKNKANVKGSLQKQIFWLLIL